jgi:hypothetical protein
MKTIFTNAAVRGPLNVYGKVNSKNLNNIVLLNSSAAIESAVSFRSLQGASINTEDNISGINFKSWYENVLWNRGKDEQVIGGNWKVKKVKLIDDATGNGLINGKSVKEIERNLRTSIGAIDATISNHHGKYLELCRDLGGKANDSRNSIHVLKHFELDFKVQELSEIFSYFTFESANENFLLVNTNCTSQLYKWEKEQEGFKLAGKVVTGVVYDWALVNSGKGEVFIVTNSQMEANYPCMYGGLNVWKIIADQIFHVTSIAKDSEVLELHVNPYQPGRFFTLNNLDLVMHFDVFGQPLDKWQLPMEHYNYSFVPPEVGSDVTLYNGRKLFMLESKFKSRQTRFLWNTKNNEPWLSSAPIMNLTKSQNPGESPIYTLKQPAPVQKDKFSLPSIPAKPLVRVDDEADFVTRIRNVGDALQRSMGDSFVKVNKLTIKNATGIDMKADEKLWVNEKTAEPPIERNDINSSTTEDSTLKKSSNPDKSSSSSPKATIESSSATKTSENKTKSFIVISPKSNSTEVGSTFMQKLKNVGKAVGNTVKFFGTLDPKYLKAQNIRTEETTMESSGDVKASSEKPQVTSSTTSSETKEAFKDSEKTEDSERLEDSKKVKDEDSSDAKKSENSKNHEKTTSSINDENSKNSENSENANKTEKARKPELHSTTVTPSHQPATSNVSFKPSLPSENQRIPSIKPQIILPPEDENFTDNLEFPAETTKFPEVTDEVLLDLEQPVPHEVLTGSGVRQTENSFFPERGAGEFVMMYVGPRYQKRPLYAVTRSRDSIVKGNHNIIEVKRSFLRKHLKF